jgi:DNA-directed RNA polymerase I subunit RPA43
MSTELSLIQTHAQKDKTHRKHKDTSKKHSSKKRRHEEQASSQTTDLQLSQSSPSKKRRTGKEYWEHDSQLNAQALPEMAPTGTTTATSINNSTTNSPLHLQTTSLYLPLSPISQSSALTGLCAEHLSPLILTYYPPLRGIVLSYSNVRLSETSFPDSSSTTEPLPVLAKSVDEYAVSFIWATADFLVFRPQKGTWIEGYVNLQNESHLGLVYLNLFSASIPRSYLPKSWKWVEDPSSSGSSNPKTARKGGKGSAKEEGQGHFVDQNDNKVDGMVKFRIRDFETQARMESDRGFVSIEGTLLSAEEEREVEAKEREKRLGRDTREGVGGRAQRGKPVNGAHPEEIGGSTMAGPSS